MKSLQEELYELKKKDADERAHLERKHKILAVLPIGEYAPPFVHSYKLYGSVGSLAWKQQRYASIAEGKSPDTALLRTLLAQFPPVDMLKQEDSCISFIPEPETFVNNGEYTDIDPVTMRIEPASYSSDVKVEWYALVGSDLWQFDVEFPLSVAAKFGRLDIRYKRMFGRSSGEITRVESCNFYPVGSAKRIRWASSDHKTPNSFTVYWERGVNVDIPAMMEAK